MFHLLMLVAILFAGPAWGIDPQSDQLSSRWASWFAASGVQTGSTRGPISSYHVTLAPTYYTAPLPLASVRGLALEGDRPRTQGVLASTTWLNGSLQTETEVAANQGDDEGLHRGSPGDTGGETSSRMVRLGFTGIAGSLRYGMRYRRAGQAFYESPDQGSREVWSEWKRGVTTISSSIGQQWNNVAGDPGRPRVDQSYGRVGLSWSKPAWPMLSLTYSQKAVTNTIVPAGLAPQKLTDRTLEAALSYAASSWTARLASSYSLQSDLLRDGQSRVHMDTLTVSFRPLTTLTIAPMLGYRLEQQDWSGARVGSPSASVAMNFKQSRRLLLSAMGNYSSTRSSDGLVDVETVGGKGIMTWDLEQWPHWTTLISLEAGYHRQMNFVPPAAQTEDLSGIVRLVLAHP